MMVIGTRRVVMETEKKMDGMKVILKVAWAILADDLDVKERKSGESKTTTRFWLGQLD